MLRAWRTDCTQDAASNKPSTSSTGLPRLCALDASVRTVPAPWGESLQTDRSRRQTLAWQPGLHSHRLGLDRWNRQVAGSRREGDDVLLLWQVLWQTRGKRDGRSGPDD